jgi:hypothetical protein
MSWRRAPFILLFAIVVVVGVFFLTRQEPRKNGRMGEFLRTHDAGREAARPPEPPPTYVAMPSDLEAVKMIDDLDLSEMSRSEQDAWWKRYHELLDKAHKERESQPPHPHTP